MSSDTRDLIVVGGASAAMTSAIYAVRSGMDVLVIADEYGGQINNTDVVENYLGFKSISGPDLADKFLEHMREYDVDEEVGSPVVDIRKDDDTFEVETEEGDTFRSHSVILCTGGSRRRLDVPGEEEFRNKGVAYCAVCDGPLYQDEEVAIIGGGYAGTEAALYMSDIAEKVHVIDFAEEMSGEEITIKQVKDADNVEFTGGAKIKEIYGDDMVQGLKYEKDGETHDLEVTGVFVEIGTVPNSDITELVETNDDGYIKVGEDMETATEGLYAAGDVNNKGAQQVAVSSGQGCQAALNASDYVKEKKAEN
jgi:alkyl hydroperoxide reductase subunit F